MDIFEKYPQELVRDRNEIEAAFIFSLWKNPELYDDYYKVNVGEDETIKTDDGKFYFLLGKSMYRKNYKTFDDITITTYLKNYPEIEKRFEEYGGLTSIHEMLSLVSTDNIEGYYDALVKNNILLSLHDKGFSVTENIDKFNKMTAAQVYDYFEYQLNSISIDSDSSFEIEDLLIDDEFIEECDSGVARGLNYGKACPILNNITMGLPLGELFMIGGYSGVGKALAVDEPVLTPYGFKPMKEIKEGDFVIGEDGARTKVIGVYPQGKRDAYEITFTDNTSIICDAEHLWKVTNDLKGEWETLTTAQLLEKEYTSYYLPNQAPVDGLGSKKKYQQKPTAKEYGKKIGSDETLLNDENAELRLNVLLWNLEDRENFLEAFMCEHDKFNKTGVKVRSQKLRDQLAQLFRSIGYRVYTSDGRKNYSFTYDGQHLKITNIKKLKKQVEMQCIRVANQTHTYLCKNFVVTHNSSFVFENMVLTLAQNDVKCAVISNEQRSKDFKILLLEHILTKEMNYAALTRKKIKQGDFTPEQRAKIKEAAKIAEEKYCNIKFAKLFDNDFSKVQKIIKKLSKVGYQLFMFDTMKSEDEINEAMWQQLLMHSRKLFQLASKENISIVCTYQLALHTLNRRYLDASCLSNAKQIKEVFSEMIYLRELWDDEYPGEKYDVKPYQMERDANGKYTGNKVEQKVDPDERYVIAFVDKTRNDDGKQQLLYKFTGRFNWWKEVGFCKVINSHNW